MLAGIRRERFGQPHGRWCTRDRRSD